jgi:hypothetical protein
VEASAGSNDVMLRGLNSAFRTTRFFLVGIDQTYRELQILSCEAEFRACLIIHADIRLDDIFGAKEGYSACESLGCG